MTETTLTETLDSPAFVARLMYDAATGLRKDARKLENSRRRYPSVQEALIAKKVQALHRAAAAIDEAAAVYADRD